MVQSCHPLSRLILSFSATLLLALLISFSARATTYNGLLMTNESRLILQLSPGHAQYFLTVVDPEIRRQVQKLTNLDFVSLQGTLNNNNTAIVIDSINYVGLRNLRGNWTGSDDFCYSFTSFTDISIYQKSSQNRCEYKKSQLARKLNYTVNPGTSSWLLLMADENESYLSDLILNSRQSAELSLYDPMSGYILKEIKLIR